MYKVTPLFPVALYESTLDPLTQEQLDYIISCDYGQQVSGNSGTTSGYVLDNPILESLKNKLLEHSQIYFKEILKHKQELYITTSWVNINYPNQNHGFHHHMNSVLSGVFYIKVPPNSGMMEISSSRRLMLDLHVDENYNEYNSCSFLKQPEENMLLIFPSDVDHQVNLNKSNDTRISLAFNTFIRGQIGKKTQTSYLEIK